MATVKISEELSSLVVKKKKGDYSHYVDIGISLTQQEDIMIWNDLKSSNPHLKNNDIVKLALKLLHRSLTS